MDADFPLLAQGLPTSGPLRSSGLDELFDTGEAGTNELLKQRDRRRKAGTNEIVPLLLGFRYSWVRYCKVKL